MPTPSTTSKPKDARLFRNNRSQAVRIHVEFELTGERLQRGGDQHHCDR